MTTQNVATHTGPIRWGILGCGDVTERKSGPAYQQVEGFSLDAVMARTPGKAKDFAHRHSVAKWYESVEGLLEDPDLDAIYIATPPDSHVSLALQVAAANKICSIEKPMAVNARDCEIITQAFAEKNLPLFVAYYRRCLQAFKQLKEALNKGAIGTVLHVDWQYYRPPSAQDVSEAYNWRTDPAIAPGGYFDDIACHGLDILVFLLGEVKYVKGVADNKAGLYGSADSISATWQFEQGATATGAWQFCAATKRDKVTFIGSEGSLTFSIFAQDAAVLLNQQGEIHFPMPKPDPIQKDYVTAMRDALFFGTPHPSTGITATHTSWIMDQILSPAI